MNKKRIFTKRVFSISMALTLALVVALCVCGCATGSSGSYSSFGYSHSMSDKGASGTYTKFDGTRSYTKELKAGDTIVVTITTNEGSMTATIAAPDGTTALTLAEDGTSIHTADVDGKYTVTFTGTNHSGGYSVTW